MLAPEANGAIIIAGQDYTKCYLKPKGNFAMKRLSELFKLFFPIHLLFKDRKGRALLTLAGASLLSGTVFYRWAEGWSWLDSLYFCVISLTTVGYGDLSPTRPISKIFTMFYLIGCISILLGFINAMAIHRQAQSDAEKRS